MKPSEKIKEIYIKNQNPIASIMGNSADVWVQAILEYLDEEYQSNQPKNE